MVQRGKDFMDKCHGQRDQHDGDPHLECEMWGGSNMHELPTRPLYFLPSCASFTFAWFFFVLLLVPQRVRCCFVLCMTIVLPLNEEATHCPLGLGDASDHFYDMMEQHVFRNWVTTIMSEVELMLGFCPRANVYVPTIFCILILFYFIFWS